MGLLRSRATAVAFLLLAAITFAAVVAESHPHDALDLSHAHGGLPAVSAGHEQPDRTLHVENATPLEAESCVGCLQRPRQGADGRHQPVLVGIQPSSSALAEAFAWRAAIDARRLPASRAPPRA